MVLVDYQDHDHCSVLLALQLLITYLQEYYRDGMNVDGLIEDIIQRADDYRMNSHQASGNLTMSAAEKRSIRRNMKSTAQTVVGKKKDPAG